MQTALSPQKSTTVRTSIAPRPLQLSLQALERLSPALTLRIVNRLFARPARHPWPADELIWLQQAERIQLYTRDMPVPEWDGKPLAVYRWRPQGTVRGRILLMHGWAGRASQLYSFLASLLAAGHEVIAVDAPGHGHSAGRWSSLLQFSRSLQLAVRHIGAIDGAITHSFGGPALIHAMQEGLVVPRAVLVAPPVRVTDFTGNLIRLLGLGESTRQRLHRFWEQKLGLHFADLDATRMVTGIRCETLIIHDLHDRDVPHSRGVELAEAWNAKLISTSGLGHRRLLKDPVVVDAAYNWLAQH